MHTIRVKLDSLGSDWKTPCTMAVGELNKVFKNGGIPVTLVTAATTAKGPTIDVKVDTSIGKGIIHGKTSTTVNGRGQLVKATVGLPKEVTISVSWPKIAVRAAGPGLRSVIAAHEFVHALMHGAHNTHLMAQTFQMDAGSTPKDDKLKAGGVSMPPIKLSRSSISTLKAAWK